jgi:transposase
MPAGRLERDLLAAGERVVRVPPRLMAGARQAVPTPGKSDPIDALAVARAALREPTPIAITQLRLPGPGQTYDQRRRTQGDATGEAVHALKRRIARAVYQHLKQAQQPSTTTTTATA